MGKANENLIILIPARGGSKAIPKKNIIELQGRPLLAWTADVALDSNLTSHVILSTDSQEVAEIGKSLGLTIPFLRPMEHISLSQSSIRGKLTLILLIQPEEE